MPPRAPPGGSVAGSRPLRASPSPNAVVATPPARRAGGDYRVYTLLRSAPLRAARQSWRDRRESCRSSRRSVDEPALAEAGAVCDLGRSSSSCPHPVMGPGVAGSPDVLVNRAPRPETRGPGHPRRLLRRQPLERRSSIAWGFPRMTRPRAARTASRRRVKGVVRGALRSSGACCDEQARTPRVRVKLPHDRTQSARAAPRGGHQAGLSTARARRAAR